MAQGTDMHEEKVYKNFICLRRLLELRNFTRNFFTQKWHLFIEKEQPPALPPKKVYSVKILYRQKENKRTTVIKIGERKNREDICGCISMLHTQIFLTDLCTFNQTLLISVSLELSILKQQLEFLQTRNFIFNRLVFAPITTKFLNAIWMLKVRLSLKYSLFMTS